MRERVCVSLWRPRADIVRTTHCTMSLASSRQDASADLAVVPGFSPASPVPKKRKVVEFSARMPPVGFFPAVWYCDGSIALNLVFDPSSFSSRGAAMAKAISFRLPPSQSPPLDLLAVTGFANGTGKSRSRGVGDVSKYAGAGGRSTGGREPL